MVFQAELYPSNWDAMRAEKLKLAGYKCEECGIADRAIQENTRTKNPYMVHLSIAHKNQYETWKTDAETRVLCQRCHRRYDRRLRRKAGTRAHSPIGYAAIYVEDQGRRVLAAMPRTFDDLWDVLSALPPGPFELQLVVVLAVVGNGHYHKQKNGK